MWEGLIVFYAAFVEQERYGMVNGYDINIGEL
jgi:hypothetical protein